MRKRTRIAVVAAALAFGTVVTSVVVATGNVRVGTDRAQPSGTVAGQHVGDGVQPALAGGPPIDWNWSTASSGG